MPKEYGQSCPVALSIAFLGERWTLLIVRDLLAGPKRFQELRESLRGVAPAVLSHRLKVLEEFGIVSSALYSQHPPRAEYTLTPRGLELRTVVRAIGIWGARHLPAKSTFVHADCGAVVEMAYACTGCGKTVKAADVQRVPRKAAGRGERPRVRASRRRARPAVSGSDRRPDRR